MRTFTPETAVAAIELEQLVTDYFDEVDRNDARNITDYFSEDCTFKAAHHSYSGRAGIRAFYDMIHSSSDGDRTTRHTLANLRIFVTGKNEANSQFIILTYRGAGKAPIKDLVGPAIITDNEMEFRRTADGQWQITALRGKPIFLSSDLANKVVSKD